MALYRVTVKLDTISYEIDADTQDEAVDIAKDNIMDETMYDITKYAEYEVVELEEASV